MPFRDILSQMLGMQEKLSPSQDFWKELERLNSGEQNRPMMDYYKESEAAAGLDLPFPSEEASGYAQQSIQDRSAEEAAAIKRKAEIAKLLAAAKIEEEQRAFIPQGDTPLAGEYDKRVRISGEGPDALKKIRAQARLKGRAGSLNEPTMILDTYKEMINGPSPRGGSFSQQPESPELTQRLAERDQWKEGQSIRDAEWEGDLARRRKDTQGSAVAGEKLLGLQKNQQIEAQQKMQQAIISKIADGSGKIPFEQAMQLEASGMQIPWGARGMAPEQFEAEINDVLQRSDADLSKAQESQMMGAPQDAVDSVIGYSLYVQNKVKQIKALVEAGTMSRDEGVAAIRKIIAAEAESSRAIQAYQLLKQGQQPAQIGE